MKNKGITLVALVVTIIILLILAGITISQLTGSGLFENARLAEQKSKNAQEKEDDILEDYEEQMKIETSREQTGGTATAEKILKDYTAYVDGNLITGTMPNNDSSAVILDSGESYTIPEGYHDGFGTVTAKVGEYKTGSFAASTSEKLTITLGFKPTYLAVLYSSNKAGNIYNGNLSETKATYFGAATSGTYYTIGSSTNNYIYSINEDGFTMNKCGSDLTVYYFAIK